MPTAPVLVRRVEGHMMGRVRGFGHVAINVSSWEQTERFYGLLLGLKFDGRVHKSDGYSIDYAAIPGGGALEFFRSAASAPAPVRATGNGDCMNGVRHVAFVVDDVTSFRNTMASAGVRIVLDITDLPGLGLRVLLVEDPNGVVVELAERLPLPVSPKLQGGRVC